jgi:hypothetical protein
MSRIKDIEHDGFEFFNPDDRSDRKRVRIREKQLELAVKENAEEAKEKAQREYLSINNPLLWDGDDED